MGWHYGLFPLGVLLGSAFNRDEMEHDENNAEIEMKARGGEIHEEEYKRAKELIEDGTGNRGKG